MESVAGKQDMSNAVQVSDLDLLIDDLYKAVAQGRRIFYDAGVIWRRCDGCREEGEMQFFGLLSNDGQRHFYCNGCVSELQRLEN